MPVKKIMASLATDLLMPIGATTENYHRDNVAMGGGDARDSGIT